MIEVADVYEKIEQFLADKVGWNLYFSKRGVRMTWDINQATEWYEKQPWLVGCNFIPSTAINQLEMFQEDTFDKETIEHEIAQRFRLQ